MVWLRAWGALVLVVLLAQCENKPVGGGANPAEKPLFTRLDSGLSGVGFVNHLNDSGEFTLIDYLYYYNGGGVATGDFNNDGLADIYLVSNREKNKCYLNKGNFKFEDVTQRAGVAGFADWQTGVTLADVNGDGWLDIYVCAVGNFQGLEGSNELYINNADAAANGGVPTFTEKGADYNLDFSGFATQAAFFDYDRDGDLDVYLLNHAVHTSRSYDRVSTRSLRNNEAGDYLMRNDLKRGPNGRLAPAKGATFTDVSEKAGIYGAPMGYGLGLAVADLNNDGWDDIFVGNDFHEDDYYYVNNANGTFTEKGKEAFPHFSRFTMGADVADLNNDGFQDLMTLDMYPADEVVEKTSLGEDPLDIFFYKLNFGYHFQYSRNCLHLNWQGQRFADAGLYAGVAATDWSWATLLADFDQDGWKDIFITNGIARRPNNLDYVKYASDDSLRFAPQTSSNLEQRALQIMPQGQVPNYFYRGTPRLEFEDKSLAWGFAEANLANGAAYADLDNDGDLDLVTNNINTPAGLYKNNREALFQHNYLKIKLEGDAPNTFGLGAKVIVKTGAGPQLQQLSLTRGFLSAVEPLLNFGLGQAARADSVVVIWPDQRMEVRLNVAPNATLVLKQSEAKLNARDFRFAQPGPAPFAEVNPSLQPAFQHRENPYYEFAREPLVPFQTSQEGPRLAVADLNNDGLDDFYVGGAKWQAGSLYLQQKNGGFARSPQPAIEADSTAEDVDAVFFDADNDRDLDLYVVSGGNEFYGQMEPLLDRLYLNNGQGQFAKHPLPPLFANKSCVRPADVDGDGDLDLFVGGRLTANQYGVAPQSYLLLNDGKANFTDQTEQLAPALRQVGLVADATWADFDQNGSPDLLVVGDWMAPAFFTNTRGRLAPAAPKFSLAANLPGTLPTLAPLGEGALQGLWHAVAAADFDRDGDQDLVLGNLGLNNKFLKEPGGRLKMWAKDFDHNGAFEQIVAYSRGGDFFPVAGKDDLGKALPGIINRRFTDYKTFAGKPVSQLFTPAELDSALVREVTEFASVYLENQGQLGFVVRPLPLPAQLSKIFVFWVEDLDADGHLDVLLGGNQYGVSMYQGRYDASYGLWLRGDGRGNFAAVLPPASGLLLTGQVRDLRKLRTPAGPVYAVARSGQPVQWFKPVARPVQ
jgi:enediyne biosynthesis protein E4